MNKKNSQIEQTEKNTQNKGSEEKGQRDKRSRQLKRTSILSAVVFVAIIIVINVILNSVVGDRWQFDWTANKMATLGSVSEQVLNENTKDVKITVLSDESAFNTAYNGADISFVPKLLSEYVAKGNGKISVDYVNPTQNPAILTTLDPDGLHNINQNNIVVSNADYSKLKVLTYNNLLQIQDYYITGYVAEEVITGAINFVTADFTPVVYWTSGHGEAGQTSNDGYSVLKMLLEQNNYLVKDLNTITATTIPDDAEMLLMVAPTADISAPEVDTYLEFLKKGGSLVVLAEYQATDLTNLNALLQNFNLRLTNDLVHENQADKVLFSDPVSFMANMPASTIYTQTAANQSAVVINSRAVTTADNASSWIKTDPVLQTSAQGSRLIGGDQANETQDQAVQTVAMYSENSGWVDGSSVTKPAKVAVFGSAMTFSDYIMLNYQTAGNYPLAFYTLYHMSNMEANAKQDYIIQPKAVITYSILPSSQTQVQVVSLFLMVILPIAMLVTALVIYRRRKNL